MFTMYYRNFGENMMKDIDTLKRNHLKATAGYDGKMKMYFIKTNDKRYDSIIWKTE